jgi:hypothetical protein
MNTRSKTSLVRAWGTFCVAGGLAACSSLLDVKNPNNVNVSDLDNPAVASAIANGALSATAYAWGAMLLEYATVSDELTWIGSRDGFRQLDVGTLGNPTNEFTDAAFPFVGRARWMADFAIKQLSGFDAAGKLKKRDDLARSYLYAAIMYTLIADQFNNFPIASDRQNAAPPVGRDKMDSLYDVAVGYTTAGIAITQKTGNKSLQTALTAMRARAEHAKAVWFVLHPAGPGVPHGGSGLVNDAAANADAAAALALAAGTPDWKFRFNYSGTTVDNYIGAWVNSRQEMRVGDSYIVQSTQDTLKDPITTLVDPEFQRAAIEFKGTSETLLYTPLTVLSARELYLILAEAALAAGDSTTEASYINQVRSLNSLPAYDPTNAAHPRPLAMLKYERKANLFLQARRLHDLYRFSERADLWSTTTPIAEAVSTPGTFFPITDVELISNPYCVANPAVCY